jgi:hypothetical protein
MTFAILLVSGVITFTVVPIILFLIKDMYHFIPMAITRLLRITGKTLLTSTLVLQFISLALSTICLIIPLIILTTLVFTKDAKAVVTQNGALLEIPSNRDLEQFMLSSYIQ